MNLEVHLSFQVFNKRSFSLLNRCNRPFVKNSVIEIFLVLIYDSYVIWLSFELSIESLSLGKESGGLTKEFLVSIHACLPSELLDLRVLYKLEACFIESIHLWTGL
jgi:hypothetical protein